MKFSPNWPKMKSLRPENAFPVVIGVHLINKNGALLPAMTGEIALPVAVDIELAHHSSSLDWRFPDRGTDSLAVPCQVAWKADIYESNRGIPTSSKSRVWLEFSPIFAHRASLCMAKQLQPHSRGRLAHFDRAC